MSHVEMIYLKALLCPSLVPDCEQWSVIIKEAVKAAMKKEFLSEMQSYVKVSDRLSDDPEDK